MGDVDDAMNAQELRWGWSLEEELTRQRSAGNERREAAFPHGETEDGKPAIPSAKLLGSYIHARPVANVLMEDREDCRDPSLPHERQAWFWALEGNYRYSTSQIKHLEQFFSQVIMTDDRVINLLNVRLDIKLCERLPADIKENLLLNIQRKLYTLAGDPDEVL